MNLSCFLCYLFFFISCQSQNKEQSPVDTASNKEYKTVKEIPPPEGFQRVAVSENTFADWLRSIHLKQDNHVYLYDGTLKKDQSAQFAVLDIPVGNKNLQQCADAVIRLRAEYLFTKKRFNEIMFSDDNGKEYKWTHRTTGRNLKNIWKLFLAGVVQLHWKNNSNLYQS